MVSLALQFEVQHLEYWWTGLQTRYCWNVTARVRLKTVVTKRWDSQEKKDMMSLWRVRVDYYDLVRASSLILASGFLVRVKKERLEYDKLDLKLVKTCSFQQQDES